MFTKKGVLIWGLFLSIVLFGLIFLQQNSFCYSTGWCRNLWGELNLVGFILFPFPFVFLFSLITYKMRDEVSRAWIKFATWWVPLQILLVAITPDSYPGAFIAIIDQQSVAIVLSGLFVIISLALIIWRSLSREK